MSVQVNPFQLWMHKPNFIITLTARGAPAGRAGPAKHSQPFSSGREQLSAIKSTETRSEIHSNYTLEGGVGDSAPANLPKSLLKGHPEASRVLKVLTPFFPSFHMGDIPFC